MIKRKNSRHKETAATTMRSESAAAATDGAVKREFLSDDSSPLPPSATATNKRSNKRIKPARERSGKKVNKEVRVQTTKVVAKRSRSKVSDEPVVRPPKLAKIKAEQPASSDSSDSPAERRVTRRSADVSVSKHHAVANDEKSTFKAGDSAIRALGKRAANSSAKRPVEYLRVGDCVQFRIDSASPLSISARRRRATTADGSSSQLPLIGRIVAIYTFKSTAGADADETGSRVSTAAGSSSATLFGADGSLPLGGSSLSVGSAGSPSSFTKLRKVSVRRAPLLVGKKANATATGEGESGDSAASGTAEPLKAGATNSSSATPVRAGSYEIHVCWFYHPQEVAIPVHPTVLSNGHALFESNHRDHNDLATVAQHIVVNSYNEFANLSSDAAVANYFVAGCYDPTKHILAYADDVRERLIKS